MIRVQGPDPTTLHRRIEHHASGLRELKEALVDALLFGRLGQDEAVHVIRQHKGGANSFSLTTADDVRYHFRSSDYRTIHVRDEFKNGNTIAVISDLEDARLFVAGVERTYFGS